MYIYIYIYTTIYKHNKKTNNTFIYIYTYIYIYIYIYMGTMGGMGPMGPLPHGTVTVIYRSRNVLAGLQAHRPTQDPKYKKTQYQTNNS